MSGPNPLHHTDLIFTNATIELKTALTELKRSNLSITNRLHSIARDATFTASIASAFKLPLLANERCGSWYILPASKAGSAYFKSTDGHHGEWSFSLRRLNLQVLDVVGENGGCIIVDSTRRGKSMSDALAKTIPIWISVLNRVALPEQRQCHELETPESVVSGSEHAQIEDRIPAFVSALAGLNLDIPTVQEKLGGRPLQPIWVTPSTNLVAAVEAVDEACHPVVLCTASSRDSENLHHVTNYVQGAADDAESWALGLDAATFWQNSEELLSASEDQLPGLIGRLVAERQVQQGVVRQPTLVRPTSQVWIANTAVTNADCSGFDVVIRCDSHITDALATPSKERYIHLVCSTGKVGSRQLRTELTKLERLSELLRPESKILVACQTGKDISVGVTLAVICRFCDDSGKLLAQQNQTSIGDQQALTKAVIKRRLSWIMISMPDASPSRATLQSVNAFLLG
ncbi:hypothetical protein B0A50_07654 [Salinomyces thailandicus]|uniref:Initiator tRNA phosphoribosyl transferase n=1 Tax=Salinomyces thailandicus TaxID=706561 RepID=A0A4U0TLW1_9PEZI|nr:hypothetical protein B0A50_07654 [Salinomyces thailandica]